MVLYNVTVNVDKDIEREWMEWMKHTHIPEVMNTGYFMDYKMLRMLSQEADETGTTYAIQYMAQTLGHLETYLNTAAPKIQKKSIIKYGTKLAAFRTVMEEI